MSPIVRLSVCVLAALIVAAGIVWFQDPRTGAQSKGLLNNKPAELHVFSLNGATLESALIYLDTKPILLSPMVFSIYFDLDGDGAFDAAEELGVDQVPGFAEQGLPSGFPVEFARAQDPGGRLLVLLSAAKNVPVRVVLSTLADPGTPIETVETHARRINDDVTGIVSYQGSLIGSLRQFLTLSSVHAQGGQGALREGVPDINPRKGKENECVPIAVANSLRWLSTQPGSQGSLPTQDADLLDQLGADLKWTNKGVDRANYLAGKNAFTSRNGLNLDNKKIDGVVEDGASNICALIKQEYLAGEDVELVIDFKPNSQSDQVSASHAVTIVGFQDLGNNKCQIAVHDPYTKGKPSTENYPIGRDGKINHPMGGKIPGFGGVIFSESIRKGT